jgi:hypothetical protein
MPRTYSKFDEVSLAPHYSEVLLAVSLVWQPF